MARKLLRITDSTGDTRLPWETAEEQEAVAFQFDQFNRKGYAAFSQGKKITAFDPTSDEVIMIGPIVAG